jgi:putative RecB family exonuclease
VGHLSYSAIRAFQSCPQRYYYHYILGLSEEIAISSLALGGALHASFEYHFQQLLQGQAAPLDVLLNVFWEAWRADGSKTIVFRAGEDINSIGHLADRLLRAFLGSSLAQPGGTIVGEEEELRGALVPGCPELLGRVDLLVEDDGVLGMIDFKTSRSRWGPAKVAEAAPQLLLYGELARPLAEGRSVLLAFAVLTKTKRPSFTLHPVPVHPGQVEQTKAAVAQTWQAIQAGDFYPRPSFMNCPTCPFRDRPCLAWTG